MLVSSYDTSSSKRPSNWPRSRQPQIEYGLSIRPLQGLGGIDQTAYVKNSRREKVSGESMNKSARMEQIEVLRFELEVLKREHRDLDEAIHALEDRGTGDMLTLRRLKKQKLNLKDKIVVLEDRIFPDIIA